MRDMDELTERAYRLGIEQAYLLTIGKADNEFERLRITCLLYKKGTLDKHNFVRHVHNLFSDDHGMDWCDDKESMDRLVDAILLYWVHHDQR